MLEVHAGSDSPEDQAANDLAQLIIDADPRLRTSGEVHVCIISNVQCYGQLPQDIDLVLMVSDRRSRPSQSNAGVSLLSCCVAIELKSHSGPGVFFEGATCIVRYHGEEHNVSLQSEKQKYSLRNYLDAHLKGPPPFVSNLIWLRQLPQSALPRVTTNLLGRDAKWQDFINRICDLPSTRSGAIDHVHGTRLFFDSTNILCRRLEPGTLDRRKMEAVVRRVTAKDTQYLDRLGQQLLIFRGRGGTGKTVRLLQLANELYSQRESRVLLLTYNNALVADICRLLSLLRIRDGIGEPGIGVRTVHKLMRDWLVSLGLLEPSSDQFIADYDSLKHELLEFLSTGALDKEEIRSKKRDRSRDLAWDYVFVDECQDWPDDERDILYRLYGYEHFVLADGIDQLVRSSKSIDWRESRGTRDSQVVRLRKSLRLKAGLCDIVSAIAEELPVANWDLQPEPDIFGGKLIVLAGTPYSRGIHDSITQDTLRTGNSIIDMLICVPPLHVHENVDGERSSEIATTLLEWGCEVWDGASSGVRSTYPTSTEQYRIVQYDSCRGLEGWCVVCLELDQLYDYKKSQYEPGESPDLFADPNSLAKAFASRWVMIPLTRAIDTLVIQLSQLDHPVTRALHRAAKKYPEVVEWRTT